MLRLIKIILFFFICSGCFSQGENNIWYFANAGLNFNSGIPVPLLNGSLGSIYASTCISDSNGNFLLESNSWQIKNKNHQILPNGNGIYGDGNTANSSFLIKKKGIDSIYYLFTVRHTHSWPPPYYIGLYYSLIDLRLDNGLGDIIPGFKNVPVPGGENVAYPLAATRARNNKDIWLICMDTSSHYLSYLINENGIITPPVISQSSLYKLHADSIDGAQSQMSISRDGTKLALALVGDTMVEFCNFNTSTGEVNSLFKFYPRDSIGQKTFPFSVEFSVKGTFLYLNSNLRHLIQYETASLDSATLLQSAVSFLLNPIYAQDDGLQLAVDNKIYQQPYTNGIYLNVINNPENKGAACNFQLNSFFLGGKYGAAYCPVFLQSYKAYIHDSLICLGDSTHFHGDIWPLADSVRWNFGDPASGVNNISTLPNPVHVYPSAGNYTVELYVRHDDNRTDTSWKTITIHPKPLVNLGSDRGICAGDSVLLDAGFCTGCTYQWRDLTQSKVVGNSQTYYASQTGLYAVSVTNSGPCTGTDTIQVTIVPPPQITNTLFADTVCSGQSANLALISVPGTLFHWTASLSSGSVSGFSADSGLVINQVLTNTGPGPGMVIYHVTPKLGNCTGTPADFTVTVNPGDSLRVSILASDTNICAGDLVSFSATTTGTGTLSYQWQVNSANNGTNSSTFSYTPVNGDVIKCIVSSSTTECVSNNPATSEQITMIVNPVLVPSIAVVPPPGIICQGTYGTYGTSIAHGGLFPAYQWNVNGINVGTGQPTYSYIPANGDLISCTVTSSEQCAFPNQVPSSQIAVSTSPMLAVDVTINPNQNPICSGQTITFTATPMNCGTNPIYQWKVNNINVGTNLNVYSFIPSNNDIVTCTLTSNVSCPILNPVSSMQHPVSVIQSPIVNFSFCFDTITTTIAKPFKLKGGIPLGGIYSGVGVNSSTGIFTPSLAGTGSKAVTYSYTNSGSCSDSKTKNIIVQAPAIFSCGNEFRDIRDNRDYKTVLIGSQCWFAEDLNYGTEITLNQHQRDNCIPEKYRNPASSIQHPASGYQWDELMQYSGIPGQQGLCPAGWHVPTEAEWQILFSNWTNSGFAGSALKYTGFSGFDALLLGSSHQNTIWKYQDFAGFFWSSTAHGPDKAVSHGMNYTNPSVSTYYSSKNNAFAVRCIYD